MKRLIQLSDEDVMKIDVTWETFSYPELKAKIRKLYDDENNEQCEIADLLSALYWDVIILKQKEIRKRSENNGRY